MTRKPTPDAVSLAGLTGWTTTFDRTAGARVPIIPEDPGIIHAVRPRPTEIDMHEASFLEDTYLYRAALCGAKVKVIMPNTFKANEDGACQACARQVPTPSRVRPGTPASKMFTMGDIWSPRAWRKKQRRNPQQRPE